MDKILDFPRHLFWLRTVTEEALYCCVPLTTTRFVLLRPFYSACLEQWEDVQIISKASHHKDVNSIARCIDPDVASVNHWPCLFLFHPPRRDHHLPAEVLLLPAIMIVKMMSSWLEKLKTAKKHKKGFAMIL